MKDDINDSKDKDSVWDEGLRNPFKFNDTVNKSVKPLIHDMWDEWMVDEDGKFYTFSYKGVEDSNENIMRNDLKPSVDLINRRLELFLCELKDLYKLKYGSLSETDNCANSDAKKRKLKN